MNKAETYEFLNKSGINYEITEHKAVFNMEELGEVKLPYHEFDANYYLITVKGDKRVNLKELRKKYGLRNLSFASAEELMKIMGLTPGSVTPLGLLNDEEHIVKFYLDSEFNGTLIGVHPNDNTATVWLKSEDLIKIIKEHGNEVSLAEI